MSVHIQHMTSEVVAPEAPAPEAKEGGRATHWDQRIAHRTRRARLDEDRARTTARGFDD